MNFSSIKSIQSLLFAQTGSSSRRRLVCISVYGLSQHLPAENLSLEMPGTGPGTFHMQSTCSSTILIQAFLEHALLLLIFSFASFSQMPNTESRIIITYQLISPPFAFFVTRAFQKSCVLSMTLIAKSYRVFLKKKKKFNLF